MSTLGGSRGERHAKPKFSTIDINTLHQNTQGETSEPSTQSKQAPRKHGMQSLGKVPSARRPPANLPSLRAETSTLSEQPGSTWGGSSGTVSGNNTENQSVVQTTNTNTSLQQPPQIPPTSVTNTIPITTINNNQSNSQLSNTQQNSVTNIATAASPSNNNNLNTSAPTNSISSNSSAASATWSSVTTGTVQDSSGQPPLFQSPQFQHEFPSLDGSTVTGSKGNHHSAAQPPHVNLSGQIIGVHQQEMTLRPQTTAGNWIQQQQTQSSQHQQGGGNRGENIGNGQNSQQGQVHQNQVPLPFQSLMPSFMVRGGGGAQGQTGGGGQNQFGGSHSQQHNYQQIQARPRSQPGAQSQPMYEQNYYGGPGQCLPPRRNQPPPTVQNKRQDDRQSSSLPFIEPEVALHQRPIIKEEELEKIQSIAKDEGWANEDDIDYNQKLHFSDDEIGDDERPQTSTNQKHDRKGHSNENAAALRLQRQQEEEEKRAAWREKEHDRNERERNERNERDRIQAQLASQHTSQQNGHRNEPDFNDRRSNELSDKKKFQEIENKPNKPIVMLKKSPSDREFINERDRVEEDKRMQQPQLPQKSLNDDFRSMTQIGGDRDRERDRDRDRDRDRNYDRNNMRDKDVASIRYDYRLYEKHDRDRDSYRDSRDRDRDRDIMMRDRDGGGGLGPPFSKQFQSNLPPRFQKQQMERGDRPNISGGIGSGSGNSYNSSNRNSTANNFHQNNEKNVPFAQQYDARFIHSNYKSQQQSQQIRRNPSDEMMRNRGGRGGRGERNNIDSEDDERFSSGRESISRNSAGGTPQLVRSISDSSQRKTSVSSNDEKCGPNGNNLSGSMHYDRIERSNSREFTGSWADEMEGEVLKKLEATSISTTNKTESISSDHSSSKESHDEPPKQILQRSKITPPPTSHTPTILESSKEKERKNSEDLNISSDKEKSPKSWADSVPDTSIDSLKSITQIAEKPENLISSDQQQQQLSITPIDTPSQSHHKKSLDSIPEKPLPPTQTLNTSSSSESKDKIEKNVKENQSDNIDIKHGAKRPIPNQRGGGNNSSGSNRHYQTSSTRGSVGGGSGGYGGYQRNNWNHHNNSNRRGPRMGGGRYGEHNSSESDGTEDEEYNRRSERSPKVPRKDNSNQRYESGRLGQGGNTGSNSSSSGGQQNKEGFAPRGEPSRRGRGASAAPRRGGNISSKRIEGYGPPSSKSPFGTNDESKQDSPNINKSKEIEDKTKLNQIALTSGLMASKSIKKDDQTEIRNETGNTSMNSSGKLNASNTKGYNTSSISIDKKLSPPKSTSSSSINLSSTTSSGNKGQMNSKSESLSQSGITKKDDKIVKKDEQPRQQTQNNSGISNKAKEQQGITTNSTTKPTVTKSNIVSGMTSANNVIQKSFGGPASSGPPQQNQQQQQQQHNKQKIHQQMNNRQTNSKLAPRFVKQQMESNRNHRSIDNNNSSSSANNNMMMTSSGQGSTNAWEKPLNTTLRTNDENKNFEQLQNDCEENNSTSNATNEKAQQQTVSSNKTENNNSGKTLLDGSTPPVNTIIFENTNYKTTPAPIKRQTTSSPSSHQMPPPSSKSNNDDVFMKSNSAQPPSTTLPNMLEVQQPSTESLTSALSGMSFPSKSDAEYEPDMKLAFAFEPDFSQLTDDKNSSVQSGSSSNSKPSGNNNTNNSANNNNNPNASASGLCMARSIHSVASPASQNIQIHPSAADLNIKIASVKKVWDNIPSMPTVLEQTDDHPSHIASNFVSQHQQHLHQYVPHGNMANVHTLSPGPSYTNSLCNDPNALEQHFGKQDGSVESEYANNQQHSVGHPNHSQYQNQNLNLVKHAEALATNSNVCKVKPNQQQIHQTGLAGLSPPPMQQGTLQTAPQQYYQPTQFGAIPSPPAVLFNSSPMPSQAGLYTPFQIEPGRSQYSQYPAHYGTSNAPYNAYMQTPPNIQAGPTPDMYQSLSSQYRMAQTPFNQNQQMNNPNTVLISSSSNSLMSASVKPSSQQIGAIGSKTPTVGHPIGQQYMNMYTQQAPLQSNSYYSNSAGSQGAFFGGPNAGAAQNYGLQATGMFGGHGGPAPSNPPPQQPVANFSSQYLSSPLLTAAAINQQYRTGPTPQAAAYLKSNQPQSHIQDPTGRQLKSPLNSDVGLNLKQPPPQTSPPHHKNYPPSWELQNQVLQQTQNLSRNNASVMAPGLSTGRGCPPPGQQQRYIAPIQRPTNYPQPLQNIQSAQMPNRNPRLNINQNSNHNKHYINPNSSGGGAGRGSHGPNTIDQNLKANDKNMDVQGGNTGIVQNSQDITTKDEGTNE